MRKILGLLVLVTMILLVTGCEVDLFDDESVTDSTSSIDSKEKKEKFTNEVTSQYSDDAGFAYYVEGTVKNNTNKDYSYLQIEFVCYDTEGNNLGTALDNTNNLLADQTWKYKAMFAGSNSENIDHCDYHEVTGW